MIRGVLFNRHLDNRAFDHSEPAADRHFYVGDFVFGWLVRFRPFELMMRYVTRTQEIRNHPDDLKWHRYAELVASLVY